MANVDWDGYCKIYKAMAPNRIRITYDQGRLELMSPSPEHERIKSQLSCILEALFMAFEVDFLNGGSTTFNSQLLDKGFEPDECYWLTHLEQVADLSTYDTQTSPPPDLGIEVDVSSSSMNRAGLYAAFGVTELWRYEQDETIRLLRLENGVYHPVARSLFLPRVEPTQVGEFVEMGKTLITSRLIREVQKWAVHQRSE
ncbi:MAG: Uma2 family endonuclease [Candidatus Eremiobacteraeota bacterium]|nr:Uma2 family endonuclease [Candidatus Eremiobacteraeota bacterium]